MACCRWPLGCRVVSFDILVFLPCCHHHLVGYRRIALLLSCSVVVAGSPPLWPFAFGWLAAWAVCNSGPILLDFPLLFTQKRTIVPVWQLISHVPAENRDDPFRPLSGNLAARDAPFPRVICRSRRAGGVSMRLDDPCKFCVPTMPIAKLERCDPGRSLT